MDGTFSEPEWQKYFRQILEKILDTVGGYNKDKKKSVLKAENREDTAQ